MSTLLPSAVYDTTKSVLLAAQSAFTDAELKQYDSYLTHGPDAEDCCGLLIAYADNINSTVGNIKAGEGADIGLYVYTAQIVVSLRECTPGMGTNGEAPSGTQKDAYAELSYRHVWQIIQAIICARRAGTLFPGGICTFNSPPSAQLIEDQGMCAGWDIEMIVELTSE